MYELKFINLIYRHTIEGSIILTMVGYYMDGIMKTGSYLILVYTVLHNNLLK